jgi:putative PIN family toxin of toxin-antitoxin system
VRIVLDTNVLVSGVLNPHGLPGRIVEAMLARMFVVLYDDRIMSEYRAVLLRPVFRFETAEIEAMLDHIERSGENIVGMPTALILPDATDLPFLEVAIAGHADALVTGNLKHFKPKRGLHGVTVLSPAELVRQLA